MAKEKVRTLFWIQSTDGGGCVLEGQRGGGQDTSDPNKVLPELQSHLPLNAETLGKPRKENEEEKG